MARYVSLPKELVASPLVFGKKPCTTYTAFGSGQFEFFGVSGTFTVPTGVTKVRVSALGAGGAPSCACSPSMSCPCHPSMGGHGGGGGGYVLAEVDVTPGTACTITVGAYPGGTTCMGTQIIAAGGCAGVTFEGFCCGNYGQTCDYRTSGVGRGCGGCGGTGTANTAASVTCLITATGSCGGCGLCGCAQVMASCFSHTCTNCGNCNIYHFPVMGGKGGAAGSYLGTTTQSEFPGTTGSDLFACKAFNGEAVAINDVSVPLVKPRWPGEFIVSTSRLDTSIAGTAAGYPCPTYIASVFGGANSVSCNCEVATRCFGIAGCGGGGGGGQQPQSVFRCVCSYSNQNFCFQCPCGCSGSSFTCAPGGNGYFVVEY